MSYGILCTVSESNDGVNYTPTGVKVLKVPKIDTNRTNVYPDNNTWNEIVGIIHDNGFNLLDVPKPLGGSAYYDAPTLLEIKTPLYNINNKVGFTNGDTKYYKFTIVNNDSIDRSIILKLTRNRYSESDNNITCLFSFYNGPTLKFSVTETTCSTEIGEWTSTTRRLYWKGTTFPWIGKYNGRDTVGIFAVNCGYSYPLSTPQGPLTDVTLSGTYYHSTSNVDAFNQWLSGYKPQEIDDENPYSGGGTSNIGGGNGNFSEDSDDPTTDDLPDIGAVGTGMATIFKPSRSQLRALSELFWNSNFFTFLQNLVENITNMFISLAMVPFNVQAGNTVSVTWLGIDTAVSLTLAAKQFYEFDMGTIDLANDARIFTSGSALDYAPFSSLGIYLPFIGYRDLDIDECRGAGVNLRYRIDILSGSCVAIIKVGGKDIYEFTGNCLTQIPITNENMQSLVSDAVNIGLAVANAESAGAVASGVEADAIAAGEPLTAEKSAHMDQMVGRSRGQLASATANAAMGMKPNFAKTGAVSGSVAMMSVKQPYLFLKTPRQSIPDHYQRYCGFPSNISGRLGDFSGYTVVEDIRLNGLVATSPEVAEIYKLLKSGVII